MILDKEKDMIIIIDMINGFTYEGAFASENVVNIIEPMAKFVKANLDAKVLTIHYTDAHPIDAIEFNTYPTHCIIDSNESKPVKQLDFNEIEIIKKNSTNGFFAKNPFNYNKNLYIIGCVSDICIYEFALTCSKYKEQFALDQSVNVIQNLCATFDGPEHEASIIHKQFMQDLKNRGVNIITI
jgi:nicotinamidase-related amidase